MAKNCKTQKGDLHSKVKVCDDAVIKYGPTALLINEFVAHRVHKLILGDGVIQPIELTSATAKEGELTITKYGNYTTTKVATLPKTGLNYFYINNTNIPSYSIVGLTSIKPDFKGYSVSSGNFKNSYIGKKEIKGFFSAWFTSLLVNDADMYAIGNFALVEGPTAYTVSRFDLDESFAFLYKLPSKIVQRKPIAATYPSVSVRFMFDSDDQSGSSILQFAQSTIADCITFPFTPDQQEFLMKFSKISYALGKFTTMLHKLPLEEAFSQVLGHPIEEVLRTISAGFSNAKTKLSKKDAEIIYDIRAITKVGKDILGYKNKHSAEFDIILNKDISNDPDVQQFCAPLSESSIKNSHPLDSVSHIVQCITAIRYSQMLGVGLCYTALKYQNTPEIGNMLALLPEPKVNYECNYPGTINTASCNIKDPFGVTQADMDCMKDVPPVDICTLYNGFAICGSIENSEL